MPNKLAHFAIEAEDVERAKAFYETVFSWEFAAWGPPNFYRFSGAGIQGALQERRAPMPEGRKGFELTFAVGDLEKSADLIAANGGSADGERFTIPGVGTLTGFTDTEGNEALIMQYEPHTRAEMGL